MSGPDRRTQQLPTTTQALALDPSNSGAARAFWQAQDERIRLANANVPPAQVAAQESPPPAARRQAETPRPSGDDEFSRQQSEAEDAAERDTNALSVPTRKI